MSYGPQNPIEFQHQRPVKEGDMALSRVALVGAAALAVENVTLQRPDIDEINGILAYTGVEIDNVA